MLIAICFQFSPLPARPFFYWLPWDSFSSALYRLSLSRLILSRCLALRLSGEPGRLFQCMRPDNHSAVIMSAILFSFCPFSPSLCLLVILMWRNATSLQLDIVQKSLRFLGLVQQYKPFQFENYSIDCLHKWSFFVRHTLMAWCSLHEECTLKKIWYKQKHIIKHNKVYKVSMLYLVNVTQLFLCGNFIFNNS